ncbi:hypothetical protein SAMN05443633_1127 [Chryseobacterium arachidis]|uniref:Uncharacterized protein n=1 Tax=Chryseobacterium arachidis TaxID=1416778 RepID=A0A1M5I5X1_9FLAO|nr:hypothetical protein SAMN05443633_1127 [Chryseobacterium arachidis]
MSVSDLFKPLMDCHRIDDRFIGIIKKIFAYFILKVDFTEFLKSKKLE